MPREIQEKYLQRRRQEFRDCLRFLEQKDFVALERIGHKLKGNAVTFGYSDLAEIGASLESTAHAADDSKVYDAVMAMREWITKH